MRATCSELPFYISTMIGKDNYCREQRHKQMTARPRHTELVDVALDRGTYIRG